MSKTRKRLAWPHRARVELIERLLGQFDKSSSGWLFDTSPFHVSLSNIFKRIIYASLDYAFTIRTDFTSWFSKFGILCTTDQANVFFCFFFQLFFPKRLSSYIRILSFFIIYDSYFALSLALEQALRGAPSNYVSGIWILLTCQISTNQRECKLTLKNTCQG